MAAKRKISGGLFGSQEKVKAALKQRGGFTWSIPKDGITVRFLTEPDAWFGYDEVWDEVAQSTRPLLEGEEPGRGERASYRVLTNALMRDDDRGDKVIALKLPKSLADRVNNRFVRSGTITDRDFVLSKFGEGKGTTYEVDSEPPKKITLGKYDLLNLNDVLFKELEQSTGTISTADVDDDDDVEEVEPVAEDEVEGDEVEETEDEAEEGDEAEAGDEEGDEVTLESLAEMSIAELKAWAVDLSVDVPPGVKKVDLIQLVWDGMEE